ncbi:AN1-type zinc finger protein 4-like isoform X2 [Gigantopelta aegis]|uniref:AN1-type zinc finger protein 4-like isoform X2 n=1 Tax=Gigantopelta aegis TaxID=1735272 RepID=UPI001B88BF83|nr:AN1-type zinc finger protein 4-like isoform X2 [Gigantopelta aegis]
MELFVETLTGTAFELRVSPFETIMSVKAKIQRLEGIPISHQHLIWQSVELEDDYCLHDYSIHSGATLRLVLAMRGGPINTRRVPVEDSTLREMAEYMEANRDEILDKLPNNRHVTLLVFREGDQLNFFRVVDRGDGTLTPLSETLSASVYNFNDEDDDEDCPAKEKTEENDKMKEKMTKLRVNMEKLSIHKKKAPKPPSPGQASFSSRANSRMRLRQIPSAAGRPCSQTLNKNMCLPPVGRTFSSQSLTDKNNSIETETFTPSAVDGARNWSDSSDKIGQTLHVLNEDSAMGETQPVVDCSPPGKDVDISSIASGSSLKKDLYRLSSMADSNRMLQSSAASRRRDLNLESLKEPFRPSLSSKDSAKKKSSECSSESTVKMSDLPYKRSTSSAKKEISLGLRDSVLRPTTTSRYPGIERRKEFALESLSTSEARAMSGLLKQAAIEKIGSSHIGSYVASASKTRLNSYSMGGSSCQDVRIPTPENGLMSAHLSRVSMNQDTRLVSPTHHLPPVKAKKKASKRCYACAKRTGLATSYQCRCGNNFCATHRYAESHSCTFDYKTEGRKLLEQSNPVVSAPKLPKI